MNCAVYGFVVPLLTRHIRVRRKGHVHRLTQISSSLYEIAWRVNECKDFFVIDNKI
ncbi:hypothetical protein STFR1_30017 [Bacillus vallismortis]